MDLDASTVAERRTRLGWSQQALAGAAGLDVRTIQRIESSGRASPSSARAIADALDVDVVDLELPDQSLVPCPECRSDDVRRHVDAVDTSTIGGQLFPGLAPGRFSSAHLHVVACAGCGNVRFFLDDDAVARLRSAPSWPVVR